LRRRLKEINYALRRQVAYSPKLISVRAIRTTSSAMATCPPPVGPFVLGIVTTEVVGIVPEGLVAIP
jgi:hypothetical protein